MEQALLQFTSESLASASRSFLDKLGLKYTNSSDSSMPKASLFKKVQLSKTIEEAFDIVSDIYFIGKIDERSFTTSHDAIDINTAISRAEGEKYNGLFIFAIKVSSEASRLVLQMTTF